MTVRAIRGAVQVDADDRDAILEATAELVTAVLNRNELTPDDVISVLFTVTPDLTAEFPALAARKIGFHAVPLRRRLRSRKKTSPLSRTSKKSDVSSVKSFALRTALLCPPKSLPSKSEV